MDASTVRPMETRQRLSLPAMRWIAGGLLFVMAVLYLVALLHGEGGHPAWGYLRAFAEASLVGGLADWFAVTALFRHPLGLPIPHTAVIPNSKNRIADALGDFVTVNFLAPSVIDAHLKDRDLANALGRQLADPVSARRIANGVMDALPAIAGLLDDEVVADFLRRQIGDLTRDERLSPLVGRGLKLLTEHGRHQLILDAAVSEGWRALEQHEPAIRAQVRSQTSWVWRIISLDARASDALIGAIEQTLEDIAEHQDHPVRQRVTELLQKFADELEHSPQLRVQIEQIARDVLAHPAVGAYFGEIWRGLKEAAHASASAPGAEARAALADGVQRFGAALLEDADVRDTINRRLRGLLTEIASRHGGDVAGLISQTIRNWDTRTVVDKLEQNVGPDLQYIRINGTLIGGLIGLAIHQLSVLLV